MVRVAVRMTGVREKARTIRPVLAVNTVRFQQLSQMFHHYNTYIERGLVARRIAGFVRDSFANTWRIGRVQGRILSTTPGKKWFIETVLNVLGERIKSVDGDVKDKLGELRKELYSKEGLGKLVGDNTLSGKSFVRNVESRIREVLGEGYGSVVEKAVKTAYTSMLFAKIGVYDAGNSKRVAVYDILTGKLYTDDGVKELRIEDWDSYRKVSAELVKHNINLSREDYYDLKNSRLILKALIGSSNEKEARNLYVKLHSEELARDPYFSAFFHEKARSEVVKTYNAAAIMTMVQDVLTKLPSYLVTMLSRLLSRAVAVIPVLGSIASIHYEAAGAITELGDRLGDRLQSSAHMWYSPANTAPFIKDAFMRLVQGQQESLQQPPQQEPSSPTSK